VIVYQSRLDNTELGARTFTIHSDGTDERVLPRALGEGSFPSWSPDGRRLAYSNGIGIAVFDLERGQTQTLTNCSNCYGDMFPAWSPDGKQIAFVREDRQARWSLYVIDLTTGTVTRLGPPGTQQFAPAWRP
jgi:TolB protein